MKEGHGDGEKLISNGHRSSYNESDKGGNAISL